MSISGYTIPTGKAVKGSAVAANFQGYYRRQYCPVKCCPVIARIFEMMSRKFAILLMAVVLSGCGKPPQKVRIPFEAVFAGSAIGCDDSSAVNLTDLRFYVFDVQLVDEFGNTQQLELTADGLWQRGGLALIDLESGSGSCSNGTSETNAVVRGKVPQGNYRGLEFTVGVPFEWNHGDPLTAESPLGDPDMHWHWRGGYKFLRAGMRSANDGFWIHLGSTGCQGTIRNITGCNAPNRVTVRLHEYVPGDTVIADLAALVSQDDLDDGVPGDCSSGPAETPCADAFRALGLDHASGAASGAQRLFSGRHR